jgi:glycosyltransferase involved in cell wall biosynthesis
MKILIAVHHFPPRYWGGGERQAYRTALALQRRGHTVKVVCVDYADRGPSDGVMWKDDEYNGISMHRLSFNQKFVPDPITWEYDNAWIGSHLQDLIDDFQPDLLHCLGGYLISGSPILVAKERHVPVVVTLLDFWYICRRITMSRSDGKLSTLPINPITCARCLGEEKRRYRWLTRIAPDVAKFYWHKQTTQARNIQARKDFLFQALNQADAIISPSQFLRSLYIQAGVNPAHIIFSRFGLDPAIIPSKKTSELVLHDQLRITYLGQIIEAKGVHILLQAVRQLATLPLLVKIYGNAGCSPQYTAQLRRIIANDNRICMAGSYQEQQELSQILDATDVVVVPSTWFENSPTVILEAFTYSVPVITSNLGGMAELVQDGKTGLLFKPGDPDDLARCIRRLVEEPGLIATLRTGIKPVRSLDEEMDQLEMIYRQILNGKSA